MVGKPKAPITLIRAARWAACVFGLPEGMDLSRATVAELEAFVAPARQRSPFRSRRVDLFADPKRDGRGTVIGAAFRWLIDSAEESMDASAYSVTQRVFSRQWHVYARANGGRRTHNRSSFANNVGPYARLSGCVLRVFPVRDVIHSVDRPHVQWIGPCAAEWLRALLDAELDAAFAMMERRLFLMEAMADPSTPAEIDPLAERAIAERWLTRIRTEISRRTEHTPGLAGER